MTKTLAGPAARPRTVAVLRARSWRPGPDSLALMALAALFALVAALSWRKWGVPEIDAGSELTTADLVARGAAPYDDVRYFYGPLGLYALVAAFKLFGATFTTAYAFGLIQAAAILGVFYALARRWLRPVAAGLTTAVLLAIGFSGTAFNFVLPHTNSATFGVLFVLLMLLALAHDRQLAAGLAAGCVVLTRPEFAAVAAAVAGAYVAGVWREDGRSPALGAAWRLALPGLALPAAVLGYFAVQAGAGRLLTENLWPVDFIRISGFRTQQHWMPFTLSSFAGLALRALVYGGLLAALASAALLWSGGTRRARAGASRLLAAWPLAAALGALLAGDFLLRALGLLDAQRSAIEDDVRHLVIGMTWLPALAFGAAAWSIVCLARGRPSPLGRRRAVDLALVAAAAALGLRAYNAFGTEGSYAVYYAAPLVLLLGLLHQRIADRLPAARPAMLAALGLVAVGLSAYAMRGLYADQTTAVNTPRGTFVTDAASAKAIQGTIDGVMRRTRPGERILAAPADGGLYFMTGRRPALYDVMLLPGLLDSPADERAAIAALRRGRVRLAVVAARDFSKWGSGATFGVDYNRVLGDYLRSATRQRQVVGSLADAQAGTNPSRGLELLSLGGSPTGGRPAVHVADRRCDDARTLAQARSPATPVCDIGHALALAPPGWAVRVGPGSYPALVVAGDGGRERDVIVAGDGSGPVRLPRIEVRDGVGGLGFTGLELTGTDEAPSFKVAEGGSSAIRLSDSRVHSVRQHAIELGAGTSRVTVERNHIHTEELGSGLMMASQSDVPGAPEEADPQPAISDVVVRANHFDGIAVDGIRPANFRRLLIERNEFNGIHETGAHNDVLQVVWGGSGLVFRDNLVHDNSGQGFFIKDGRVHDVTIAGNLFVRNRRVRPSDPLAGSPIQLSDTIGVRLLGNTVWDNDSAVLLRAGTRDVTIANNILEGLVGDEVELAQLRRSVRQDYNLVASGWNWGRQGAVGAHDIAAGERKDLRPRFVDPAALDYRLDDGSAGLDAGTSRHESGRTGACSAPYDSSATPNSGAGPRPFLDMGARERRPGC